MFASLASAAGTESGLSLPDTQTPVFTEIVSRYTAALAAAQSQYVTAMSRHIQRYLDEAEEMLKEKRKTRNTIGIAIATTSKGIFETALSNLTTTGTFEIPVKVRRELETTTAEFSTGRTLLETSLAGKKSALFKQYSDEFAAQILAVSPALTSPEARAKIDDRFKTMAEDKAPPRPLKPDGTVSNAPGAVTGALAPILEESGSADSWMTAGILTTSVRTMEVIELSLADMHPGTNVMKQYNPISESSTEINYVATQTNVMNPAMVYRLKRITDYGGVTVMEWPKAANGFRLTARTPNPEKGSCPVGFEFQIAIPGQNVADTLNARPGATSPRPKSAARTITLTVKSTPPRAAVLIDDIAVPNTFTPCSLPIPVGPHRFQLSLPGYKDLIVTNYVFTADRQINWTFKPSR